jgi:hypothetical protein
LRKNELETGRMSLCRFLFPKLFLKRFQFSTHLLGVIRIRADADGFYPIALGLLKVAGLKIKITQMLHDGGIVLNDFIGFKKVLLGIFQVVQLEVSPSERIEISTVSWIDG